MIDEDRTLQLYGYYSDELKPKSKKPVVAVCEECGVYRVVRRASYRELCRSCATQNRPPITMETRRRLSEAGKGRPVSEDTKRRMSEAARNISDETRRKLSAANQGIPYTEWVGFATDGLYCHKFNDSCREHNRDKYGRACFICGKGEEDNGQRLSVHHVDMSKSQGCDGEKWKLVPVCRSCHRRAHNKTWQTRIEYLLKG